jgi:hypothetical protein
VYVSIAAQVYGRFFEFDYKTLNMMFLCITFEIAYIEPFFTYFTDNVHVPFNKGIK